MPDVSAVLALAAIHSTRRIRGLTHGFYRYPAATSPELIREIILKFTRPDDIVLDPFVGGGTTVVEALAHGRMAIASDLNSLAVLVTRAKTTPLSEPQWAKLADWAARQPFRTSNGIQHNEPLARNLPVGIEAALRAAIQSLQTLDGADVCRVARTSLLETGRWAVESGREVRSEDALGSRLIRRLHEMRTGMRDLELHAASFGQPKQRIRARRQLFHMPAEELPTRLSPAGGFVKLLLTSPPYPGVHVLYHRWQVGGRRETPAPYWIANARDGASASYYTMGGRSEAGQAEYFRQITRVFHRLRPLLTPDAIVVQLVAFHDIDSQLTKFNEAMGQAGYGAVGVSDSLSRRIVPNRRWYAAGGDGDAAKEYLLTYFPNAGPGPL